MTRAFLIGAGVCALLTAAIPAPGHAAENTMNPLLAPWTGPYGGVPPFDQVKVEHFKPALEAGMEEKLREIDAIANEHGAADLREHASPRWKTRAARSTA